jgi:hypothetical protein
MTAMRADRATHCREKAELRAMAEIEQHEGFHFQLLQLAAGYEQMAESVERWNPKRQTQKRQADKDQD